MIKIEYYLWGALPNLFMPDGESLYQNFLASSKIKIDVTSPISVTNFTPNEESER